MIISSDKPRLLYLTSLKSFDREKGIEVYRKIKNLTVSI